MEEEEEEDMTNYAAYACEHGLPTGYSCPPWRAFSLALRSFRSAAQLLGRRRALKSVEHSWTLILSSSPVRADKRNRRQEEEG